MCSQNSVGEVEAHEQAVVSHFYTDGFQKGYRCPHDPLDGWQNILWAFETKH